MSGCCMNCKSSLFLAFSLLSGSRFGGVALGVPHSSPGSSRYWKMKSCSGVRTVPKTCHYEARPIAHVDIILVSS